MPPSVTSDEPGILLSDDEEDSLFPFGPMPTAPLITRDRSQAFRFLSYGQGRRCVVTQDYEMMVAVGSPDDLKAYANGWFRAHGRLCKVVVTKARKPGWAQIVLSLEEEFYWDNDDDEDGEEVELDMGFLGAADYLDDYDDEGVEEEDDDDMMDDLDMNPNFLPDFYPRMSQSELEEEEEGEGGEEEQEEEEEEEEEEEVDVEVEENVAEVVDEVDMCEDYYDNDSEVEDHCGNCKSRTHDLADCDGPTDPTGYLGGCPLCNTTAHDVDACPLLDALPDRRLICKIYTRMVLFRRARAAFRSERMSWTRALLVSRAWGFSCPGPFSWSHEMAAARSKTEAGGDAAWIEGYEEEDPATRDIEAVRVAIREGKVPDPGDVSDWMPVRGFSPSGL